MSGSLVIVDDSNPSIKYTGNWFTQESADSISNEFNGTVHATNTGGSLLEYNFRGTGLTVYGTLATPQTGAAVSRMTVDSGTPIVFNSSAIPSTSASILSHVALFQVSSLQDGEHTVNVIVDEVPDTHTFYFDFFTVNSSEGGDQFVIMDDSDSNISYLGEWKTENVQEAYGGTHHKSPDTEGGKATIRFKGQ
ncbi:hypothetical protein CPB86DRAFT_176908 [Serendipita vermifera]|nr:hypothetical protein CPB86DRAFT_176908 [Serendipita vermifera]